MTQTPTDDEFTNDDELTGQEIEESMSEDAKQEAREELAQLAPGPSEPFRMGDEGPRTQLDEDPISEGGASRQSRA